MTVERPTLQISVEHEALYAVGLPALVAVTLQARPDDSFRRLPLADWRGTNGAFGLTLAAEGGVAASVAEPMTVFDADFGASFFALAGGEARRLVIDLAELLPEGIAPGRYQAVLSYGAPAYRSESAPFSLVLRAPNAEETATLAEHAAEVDAAGSWGQWAALPPPEGSAVTLPGTETDPIAFHKIVRFMLHGPRPLALIDEACLETVRGVLLPEAEALRAELYAAADPLAFAKQGALVRQRFPALSFWMAQIEAGQSDFQWSRRGRG
jgi:hypothetical protein